MKFLKRLTIFVVLSSVFGCDDNPKNAITQSKEKPNIVIIMTDDQGWGDLGIHQNTNLNTPNMDAIAKNGVRFDNFYVQPVCSPTRAEVLTGRYAASLGVTGTSSGGERINLGETTLAEILKSNGYQTAAYGKWHNGMQPPYHPNARGFDDFYGFASGHIGTYFNPVLERNGRLVQGKGYLPDDITNKGVQFIEQHKNDPFFLFLPFNTPHSPMQVPDEYWARFENKELSRTYLGEGDEQLDFTKAALAMVENIDFNIGRIMETLTSLSLEENTIVVFMSDNGPNSFRWNADMRGKKGSTDEGGVRSPFFMQWKGVFKAERKIDEIASSIDVLPTLVDLAGIKAETANPIDGKSLKPLLFDDKSEWKPRFVFNHWNGHTSVRSQEYRLDDEERLYRISKERSQKTDVTEGNSKIFNSLKAAKIRWLKEVLPEGETQDTRPFTLGHPDYQYTQIPARDGIPYGNIRRSNTYPNDSFFTNWISVNDSITWDVDVLTDGSYQVSILYTLSEESNGMAVQLSHGKNLMMSRIGEVHDPPLTGMENDRIPRIESYIKDFSPKILGTMHLRKGRRPLVLKTRYLPGQAGIDIRLLMFKLIP